jgi:hypothetical protein
MKSALLFGLVSALAMPAIAQEATTTPNTPEPNVRHTVVEDDAVRIEELRVRGMTQRIVVQPKKGPAKSYEVLPVDAQRDVSQPGARGAAGQRVWHAMSF